MKNPIEWCRQSVRMIMTKVAAGLNKATGGKLHPDVVTIVGALAHLPIAWLIAEGNRWWLAGLLLIFFGLFDALDGSLARLQQRESPWGMLLDSVVDRLKEVALYTGLAYYFASQDQILMAAVSALACGLSICVSYTRAAGDTSMVSSGKKFTKDQINKAFRGGLLSFELRILLIVIGLISARLSIAVSLVAFLATITVIQRMAKIHRALTA